MIESLEEAPTQRDPYEDFRFIGTCPTCGQEFCGEIIDQLRQRIVALEEKIARFLERRHA